MPSRDNEYEYRNGPLHLLCAFVWDNGKCLYLLLLSVLTLFSIL